MSIDKIFLDEEFDKFWTKIERGENFALMRNGDGERAIMSGRQVTAQEGWTSPDHLSKLGQDLIKTLEITDDNVFCAISCPCCDPGAFYWYVTRIKNKKNITFSNLWVNINYQKFKEKFDVLNRDAILIANYAAKGRAIGNLNILKHYEISDDCISFWEQDTPRMLAAIKREFGPRNNLLYVVSAGPMAGPIIAALYKTSPNNCYIDFGSSIDPYYRQNVTRPYMKRGTKYAERNCWMYDPATFDAGVSVVLTLYKRPENLALQLDAIEKQTLKPREILLYQDGTGDTAKIPESLKARFDYIKINPINVGVWGRFHFAMNRAANKYVCVFDDDTIPGNRWLENCHTEMLKREGLYGTIGIVLEKPFLYPAIFKGSHFRVGWQGNLNVTAEVDFVGHSWFFKREWLSCLFNAPEEVQNYKFAGEDMSFSYQLLAGKGIRTFVPPHPRTKPELFGSIKKYANKLGASKEAVSVNFSNVNMMTEAIGILLHKGWQILLYRNQGYVKRLKRSLGWQNSRTVFFIDKCVAYAKKRIRILLYQIK
jgi:glycosyltransferase involved in cell wall biosynthesis